MSAEIVPLREGPSLNDIVAQVRSLADRIEAGEYGEVECLFAIMPRAGDYPKLWGWGDVTNANDPIIQLELTKLWLLTMMTKRFP